MIVITSCQGLFGKIPLAVDSTRLSEPDTEIYTRGPEEPGAAQDQKKNKSERDLKFTWGINVKEHSRLSESYDLCKVYTGTVSLLKGTFKDSEVNRPVSSLEGAHPSPSPRMAQTLPQVLTSSCHFPPNFFSSFNF